MKQFDNPVLNAVPLTDEDSNIVVSGNWNDWTIPTVGTVQEI